MARSASCCTPWSCMKRLTFMANICAADIRPYGSVWAAGAGDGLHARALPEAAELALGQRPEHDDALGLAVAIAAAPLATAPEPPPPPPPHCIEAKLSCVAAERGRQARRLAAVVAVGGEPVDVARVDAGVGARLQHGLDGQLELGVGRSAPLVVLGLGDADDGDLAAQRALGHRRAPGDDGGRRRGGAVRPRRPSPALAPGAPSLPTSSASRSDRTVPPCRPVGSGLVGPSCPARPEAVEPESRCGRRPR